MMTSKDPDPMPLLGPSDMNQFGKPFVQSVRYVSGCGKKRELSVCPFRPMIENGYWKDTSYPKCVVLLGKIYQYTISYKLNAPVAQTITSNSW